MNGRMRIGSLDCRSGNPKSKIQNPKWRWVFIILITCALWEAVSEAQQAKIPKIGWLSARPASLLGLERFRPELIALGYIEGKNIAFEPRYADNNFDRLPALAADLVAQNVDVILTPSTIEAVAAKNATKTIPIVFLNAADPIASGLIDSLARPGGNITGLTNLAGILAGKRLEILKETIPKLSRVAVLWEPRTPGSVQQWKESQFPARELGLQLHSTEVSNLDKLEGAFREAIKARSGALAVTQSPLFLSNRKIIVDLTIRNRLSAIFNRDDWIDSGGLISYGPDDSEPVKRVAVMIDKILKGTKPADIPVEQPTKFVLAINLKTAKLLGLTIPPIVLMRAVRVVK
jgi:putative ABC transport system substrate-binding protein